MAKGHLTVTGIEWSQRERAALVSIPRLVAKHWTPGHREAGRASER